MWLLIFFLVFVIFLTIVLFSPVQINLSYVLNKGDIKAPDGVVKLSSPGTGVQIKLLWGLIKFHLRLSSASFGYRALKPVLKLRARLTGRHNTVAREKTRITPERARRLYVLAVRIYHATLPANKYLLEGVTMHRFSWRTGVSLDEADKTGLAVGGLWIVKSTLSAQVYRLVKKPAPLPELEVQPLFKDQLILWIRLNLNFSVKLGRMVAAGLMAAWFYLKNRKF